MKRVFIALEIPQPIQQFVGKIAPMHPLAKIPIKYENTKKIHLTLAFLGWFKEEKKLAQLTTIIRKISQDYSPFKFSTAQLGAFPNLHRPRVIWLGLSGQIERLQQLQKELNQQLKKQHYKYDDRPFLPHLTIGRVKIKKGKLKKRIGEKISQIKLPEKKFTADTLTVFESQLFRSGSVYKKIKSLKLKILDN